MFGKSKPVLSSKDKEVMLTTLRYLLHMSTSQILLSNPVPQIKLIMDLILLLKRHGVDTTIYDEEVKLDNQIFKSNGIYCMFCLGKPRDRIIKKIVKKYPDIKVKDIVWIIPGLKAEALHSVEFDNKSLTNYC